MGLGSAQKNLALGREGGGWGYLKKHISGLGSEIFDLVFLESFDLKFKIMCLKYFFGGKSVINQRDRS